MKFLKEHKFPALLLLFVAALRCYPLFNYQLTFDELSGLDRTQFDSWSDLINKGVKVDAHPALIQLLIFSIVKLFGYKTWLIKLPFILMSLAAITYGYALGYKLYGRHSGNLMAIFLSFSLVFVFYAPIARMYISGVFLSLAMVYHFLNIAVCKENTRTNFILAGLFMLLSALNHHMNALFAFTLFAGGFFMLDKKQFKHMFFTGVVVAILYLPALPVTLYQLGIGGIGSEQGGWLDKPDANAFWNFIKILCGTQWAVPLLCVFIAAAALFHKRYQLDKLQWFLLLLFAVNYLVIYYYSIYRAAIYQHSVMLFSGMAFLLFVVSLLNTNKNWLMYTIQTSLAFYLFFVTYIQKNYFGQCVQTIYEYQFEKTSGYKQKHGEHNVSAVFFDADDIMRKIFFGKYKPFDYNYGNDTMVTSIRAFSNYVSGLKCDYLVLSASFPAQQAVARQYFPYLIESTITQAINYKVYSRNPTDARKQVPDETTLQMSTPARPGLFVYQKTLPDSGFAITQADEYPFNSIADYNKTLVPEEGNIVQLKARIRLHSSQLSEIEACIAVNDFSGQTNFAYNAHAASEFSLGSDSVVTIYTDYFAGNNHRRVKNKPRISCYIWNRGKERAVLSEFEIRVLEYWRPKWHFWD